MDAKAAREALLEVRGRFDDAAKRIVETLNKNDEATETRINDAREQLRGQWGEEIVWIKQCAEKALAALEQWEITEPTPLQDDRSFMDAMRELLREVGDLGVPDN